MTDEYADSRTEADADTDTILAELNVPRGELPVDAIRAARECRQQIIPGLIELIAQATRQARDGGEPPELNGHFFALFLLAEFRAAEALPTIVEAMSLPGSLPSDLFGDGVHEAFPRVVTGMANDRLDEIVSVIRDRKIYQSVRWSAATGLALMVRAGLRPRTEIVELLRKLLRDAIQGQDDEGVLPLVHTLVELYPEEAYGEIQEAYREGLVDEFVINMNDVDRQIAVGEEETLRNLDRGKSPYVDDTAETLKNWAAFRKPDKRKPRIPKLRGPSMPAGRYREDPLPSATASPETAVDDRRRVGRNHPCPCGSGKKFKKCCGSPAKRRSEA